ncbi:hypothetical protein [Rhodococcus wratislaviensis]|uniref:hypothetical protein n=1 Tax=Rhodococcus wratislaviensis TaxID=44752 RepID=UPI00056ABAA2|nr:hypothetical protein [Rhodococcus wratislaviensis]
MTDLRPTPSESAQVGIHRARKLRIVASSFTGFGMVSAALGLTLNNAQNSLGYLVWIAGGIIMICTLVTLVRTVNEPVPSQL